MKKFLLSLFSSVLIVTNVLAQGWQANYGGVMLQGFYWDGFADTQWSYLEKQADDIAPYFSLIWVPNSGYCGDGMNMGYMPMKYFDQNSSFGTENQLRSMIQTYKEKGTGFIADVVVNHHNSEGWYNFPKETYKGKDYQLLPSDICANDDNGKTKAEATKNGVSLSPNNDTGEDWDGCRDLDHKSQNVNTIVKAYLDFLLNDLGYAGVRYDMVKGYGAEFTADYNSTAKVDFSVGEYWEGSPSPVHKWIDGTKKDGVIQSAAFDFAFRYSCRDAAHGTTASKKPGNKVTPNWSKLLNATSAANRSYNRYSVTFVENHDTEYRSATSAQDPIVADTLALNAWLLGNPGTPCVFYKHWLSYKKEIKEMIEARKLVGIHNQSTFSNVTNASETTYCAREVTGTNGSMIIVVGTKCADYQAPAGYTEILSGYHYRYLVSADCDTKGWTETIARIADEEKQGEFTPYKVTIYCKADFSPVYFYAWNHKNENLLGNWPGKLMSENVEVDGEKWFSQTFDITSKDYYFNIIFNQGNGKPQTTDIMRLTADKFFTATIKDGKIVYEDVTNQHTTAIDELPAAVKVCDVIYDMNGRPVKSMQPNQIYIRQGQKVINK